ncbi:hypothetical protein OFC56_35400, partial [Escherichia coli]|nr:hypothetical protein [Escherichia coli]
MEDVASEYFGFQISNFQIAEIVRDVEMLPISDAGEYKKISKSAMRVTTVADQFWNRFAMAQSDGRYSIFKEH